MEEIIFPNQIRMGLTQLHPAPVLTSPQPSDRIGKYARLNEKSNGKDTMTGHWEMMGLEIKTPFQTFTDTGFPKELIEALEKETGHRVIGNKAASGTEILDELAEEKIKTGAMPSASTAAFFTESPFVLPLPESSASPSSEISSSSPVSSICTESSFDSVRGLVPS